MVIVVSCVPCRSGGEGLNERQCVMSRETDRTGPQVGVASTYSQSHSCTPLSIHLWSVFVGV